MPMPTLDELSARIAEAERRVAERDAAGYETPSRARFHLAHARKEWGHLSRATMPAKTGYFESIITRALDSFDDALRAQHTADVGPLDDEEPQC